MFSDFDSDIARLPYRVLSSEDIFCDTLNGNSPFPARHFLIFFEGVDMFLGTPVFCGGGRVLSWKAYDLLWKSLSFSSRFPILWFSNLSSLVSFLPQFFIGVFRFPRFLPFLLVFRVPSGEALYD